MPFLGSLLITAKRRAAVDDRVLLCFSLSS